METQLISLSHWGMHEVPVTPATKAFIERQVIATNLANIPADKECYWTVRIAMDDPVDADFETWVEAYDYVQEVIGERLADDKRDDNFADCEFIRFYYDDELEKIVVETFEEEVRLE